MCESMHTTMKTKQLKRYQELFVLAIAVTSELSSPNSTTPSLSCTPIMWNHRPLSRRLSRRDFAKPPPPRKSRLSRDLSRENAKPAVKFTGSKTTHCHLPQHTEEQRKHPNLTPARQAGTRFTYLRGMEGWVDLNGWFYTLTSSNQLQSVEWELNARSFDHEFDILLLHHLTENAAWTHNHNCS